MKPREHKRAVKRAWHKRNKERVNAARRAKVAANREAHNAYQRQQYANMKPEQRANWSRYMYAYGLKHRFSISLVKWLAIFKLQSERCACCKCGDPGGKRWHTDHDHDSGAIRGIICVGCNTTLGRLGDNLRAVEESTARFTAYLKGGEPVWGTDGRLQIWEPK